MTNLQNLLNTKLEDDNTTPYGGISFAGETLRDFMDEAELDYNTSLEEINEALKDCGIKQI